MIECVIELNSLANQEVEFGLKIGEIIFSKIKTKVNISDMLAHYISELTKRKTLLAPDLTGVQLTVRRFDRDE